MYELRTQIWEIGSKVGNVIYNKKDIILINQQMQSQIVCPIFQISNTTFEGIDLFKNFLNYLQFSNLATELENEAYGGEFHIQQTFKKSDYILILAGIVHKGKFTQNQRTLLGPSQEGTFTIVEIQNIHCNRVPVRQVRAGQICTMLINISKCSKKWFNNAGGEIRKGMVLLDYKDKINVQACYSFKAEVWAYDGTVQTIKKTMEPYIYSQQVSQTCAIFLETDVEMAIYNQMKISEIRKKKRGKSTEIRKIDETEGQEESDYEGDIKKQNDKKNEQIQNPTNLFQSMQQSQKPFNGRKRAFSSQEDLLVKDFGTSNGDSPNISSKLR